MTDLEPASALAAIDVTPVDRPKSPAEEFALKLLTESWIDETGQHDRRVMARLIQEAEMAIRADEREPLERRIAELEGKVRWFVEKAADEKLDGYRELGQRAADAENRLDDARRRIAALEAQLGDAAVEATIARGQIAELEEKLASAREEAVDGVTLLIGAKTGVLSVFSTRHEAESARDRLNETHEGYGVLPDMDYPYRVETWSIHGADHRDDDSALRLAVKQMRADCLDCLEVGEHTSPESVLYSEFAGRLDAALEGRSWEHDEAVIEQLNATELPPPAAQKEPL